MTSTIPPNYLRRVDNCLAGIWRANRRRPSCVLDIMGGVEEVEHCIREQYDRLVRVVSLACGSTPMAEDAVQEAFARAWERAGRGDDPHHLVGWVVTVALNHTRSAYRRMGAEGRARARLRAADPSGPDPEALIDLQVALPRLPARQRQAVVLHHLLELDVSAVAELLGVSPSTVKTALVRGRASLAATLALQEEEMT